MNGTKVCQASAVLRGDQFWCTRESGHVGPHTNAKHEAAWGDDGPQFDPVELISEQEHYVTAMVADRDTTEYACRCGAVVWGVARWHVHLRAAMPRDEHEEE